MASTRFMSVGGWRKVGVIPGQLMRHVCSSSVLLSSSQSASENCQVMAADRKTIICYHSPNPVPFSETKPLRRRKVWERNSLTNEEVTLIRKLRQDDGYIWSVATLSRLFKISPTIICRVAPASAERQKQLDEERKMLTKMRPHKRKLYILQRQGTRQNKIKELIAANKYPFPATNAEPSNS